MDNTYFILSNKAIAIDRLHICTWDFIDKNAAIELGFEFMPNPYTKDIEIKLSLPFLKQTDKVTCLMDSLIRDDDNSKFIFNDTINANKAINGDKRNGAILEFKSRNSLSVLPIKQIKVEDGVCSFAINRINSTVKNYIRLYIQTGVKHLAIVNKGIAQTSYIYDIKINESRNLPNHIYELLNNGYILCNKVKSCFCFHVIPSQYSISYLNANKLKNIRVLESEGFNHYLPNTRKIRSNEFLIIFNKSEQSADGSYAFFSQFNEETIGNKQIILAIATNLICSLLFGISTLREWQAGMEWYNKLPWEFWTAIILLLLFALYLFVPWKKVVLWIKNLFKK